MKDEEIEKKHRKKMVAPIVISIMIVIYCCFYVVMCFIMPVPLVMKMIALIGVSVYNLCERIQEIRSGEEDDLSKY